MLLGCAFTSAYIFSAADVDYSSCLGAATFTSGYILYAPKEDDPKLDDGA